jgi:murein DD-endopeptidase MepM/ murein hydrolase activator NlpD
MANENSKKKLSLKQIYAITTTRRQIKNGNIKDAATNIAKSKIRYAVLRRLTPYLAGLIVALFVASVGLAAGTYVYRAFEEAAIVLKPVERDRCAEDPDEEAKFFVDLLFGGEENVVTDALKNIYSAWIGIVEGLQEEDGCREEEEIIGVEGWTWPVAEPPRVSSHYGPRVSPCAGCSSNHLGTDYPKACGAPVYAANDGIVTVAKRNFNINAGYGVWIKIEHDYETTGAKNSIYAHLLEGSMRVREGEEVVSGQLIGLVGTTGSSTGCHLHFEIEIPGGFFGLGVTKIDPHDFLLERISRQAQNTLAPPSTIAP